MKKEILKGANPYLPMWEHIPDGEPRCFTYNGEKRVYVYGSHDSLKTEYCGPEYMVWSAPADDLTNWRCEGEVLRDHTGRPLYAPDVVEKDGVYYMYAAHCNGSYIHVAKSDNPAGPFTHPVLTELGFDPGVLVDDDGKIYVYWGFCEVTGAELEPDMVTIKKDTVVKNMIPHTRATHWNPDDENSDELFQFFEASSIRKYKDKYIFIYSKMTMHPDPETGERCHSYLDYCYSDHPLKGWVYGGTITNCAGDAITMPDGSKGNAYYNCNNHGSIVEVDGKWYHFYHRLCGTDEFARQGMLEPIEVCITDDGKVLVGKIIYDENGKPVGQEPVEITSQGAYKNGIPCEALVSAGSTIHLVGGKERAYVKAVYDGVESAPVVNIHSGCVVGFRYINFGETAPKCLTIVARFKRKAVVKVHLDSPTGEVISVLEVTPYNDIIRGSVTEAATGKRAIYFEFISDFRDELGEFDNFTFDETRS